MLWVSAELTASLETNLIHFLRGQLVCSIQGNYFSSVECVIMCADYNWSFPDASIDCPSFCPYKLLWTSFFCFVLFLLFYFETESYIARSACNFPRSPNVLQTCGLLSYLCLSCSVWMCKYPGIWFVHFFEAEAETKVFSSSNIKTHLGMFLCILTVSKLCPENAWADGKSRLNSIQMVTEMMLRRQQNVVQLLAT